jgi:hypothetical protein
MQEESGQKRTLTPLSTLAPKANGPAFPYSLSPH